MNSEVWAISPSCLDVIDLEKTDIEARGIKTKDRFTAKENYQIVGNVALIPVRGILQRHQPQKKKNRLV